jgi:hypothetical protein
VYDRLRSATLSVKYYGRRLQTVERTNFALEAALLVAAPSSAVAVLGVWNTGAGHLAWQILSAIAAVLAVLKLPLGLTKRIKDYEGTLSGYRTLQFDLMELRTSIEQRRKYDPTLQAEFRKALQREKALVSRTPEATESKRIKALCEAEVKRELPSNAFFVPED